MRKSERLKAMLPNDSMDKNHQRPRHPPTMLIYFQPAPLIREGKQSKGHNRMKEEEHGDVRDQVGKRGKAEARKF